MHSLFFAFLLFLVNITQQQLKIQLSIILYSSVSKRTKKYKCFHQPSVFLLYINQRTNSAKEIANFPFFFSKIT